MLPSTMNAITIARAGGPEVLEPVTRPVPQPAAGHFGVTPNSSHFNEKAGTSPT